MRASKKTQMKSDRITVNEAVEILKTCVITQMRGKEEKAMLLGIEAMERLSDLRRTTDYGLDSCYDHYLHLLPSEREWEDD
jgi:hypothetical protein